MAPRKKVEPKQLVVMVSSTVYGIEELLDRIYTLLLAFGYNVWMSHKGTVPVIPGLSAFDCCLRAVEECDFFLSLITPQYGSGQHKGDPYSITHQELLKAIELDKPRWVLAHDHVVFARSLLRQLGYPDKANRSQLKFKPSNQLNDLRVIDMYEDACREEIPLPARQSNWVQKFETDEEALLFTTAQFSRYQEVEAFLRENLDPARIKAKGGQA